jgi:hypothetical protein
MVAACINADTGVGPAIASGNQVYNGIFDLPQAPIINKKQQDNKPKSKLAYSYILK